MVKCFRRCEVIRRAAFVAASGRVRADGRSSRPRNTLPAPDRRPRVSFVGRFGAEFAPRRHRLGRLFVRRQARVETSHDDGNHLPPPGGHGTHRGNLRQLRHGIQAAGTRAYTTRTLSSAPRPPRALALRRARARAAPRRQLFVRLRAPLSRSSGSSPSLPAQAPSESTSKRLSSEDVIKYTKDFIVQFREVRRTARRVTLTARTSLPPTDRRPSGLWSRADAAASLSFPETFFAQVFRAARANDARLRAIFSASVLESEKNASRFTHSLRVVALLRV